MGGYKHTKYREVLKYVDDRYKNNDAVYVYWNFAAQYQVYKQLGYVRYDAIQGKDVRRISRNDSTYFRNLLSDFNAAMRRKRVWILFENTMTFNIGDPEIDTWYKQGQYGTQPGKRILDRFQSMGKIIESYTTPQASAYLVELNKTE
jgi:hypothetical protein